MTAAIVARGPPRFLHLTGKEQKERPEKMEEDEKDHDPAPAASDAVKVPRDFVRQIADQITSNCENAR